MTAAMQRSVATDIKYQITLAASIPPPVAGQSIAGKMLADAIDANGIESFLVDLSEPLQNRSVVRRAVSVALMGLNVCRIAASKADRMVFYLQLGQSIKAMLRDLLLLAVARIRGWPTVLHIHGGGFRQAYNSAPKPIRWAMRKELERANRMIVLSPWLANMLEGVVDEKRITTVPNGVQEYIRIAGSRCVAPRRTNEGSKSLTVLYLSNLIPTKGYFTVLEASRLAQEHGLKHRFIMAGEHTKGVGTHPENYIRLNKLANMEFVGPVYGQDKIATFLEAQVFVLPTAYPTEGQPIAVLEAFHFGLPVVTTHQGGLRDLVKQNANGIVIRPNDADALLQAIEVLAKDLTLFNEIARNNKIKAGKYTQERHTDAIMRILAEVAWNSYGPDD